MNKSDQDIVLKYKDIDLKELEEIKKYYKDEHSKCTRRYGNKAYLLFNNAEDYLTGLIKMKLRISDIFVTSYPKSGTTWTQELVWLIANNLDFERAASHRLTERYAFFENRMHLPPDNLLSAANNESTRKALEVLFPSHTRNIELMSSPRFFKSHLPLSLLPSEILETCKVVYVARDPRDVAVSFFYHTKFMKKCTEDKSFKTLWELFIKDLVPWTPYFEHVKESWRLRNHPNMLFLFYEDLSKDLGAVAHRVAHFLGKELNDEQVAQLCEYLKFNNFKKNNSVNFQDLKNLGYSDENEFFIRKGKVGDWREHFDEEMKQQAQKWMAFNLQDTDLRFPNF